MQCEVILSSSEENWGCIASPSLSIPPLWWLWGWWISCVMGAWEPPSLYRVSSALLVGTRGSGIYLSLHQGTIVGVLDRGHWLKIGSVFSTRENDFFFFFLVHLGKAKNTSKWRQKPKPGEGIVRGARSCSRWVQVSWLGRVIPQALREYAGETAEPLSVILEEFWRTGTVLEVWRKENVLQFFDKGKQAESANYHLVSLTFILG